MRIIDLGQTTYFHFVANNTAGSGADGATAVFDVRLAGATITDAPILSGSGSLVSHVNYPDGCYEAAIVATEGNGFAVDQEYAVFATLAVDTQNPTGFVGSFYVKPIVGSITAHFTTQTTDAYSTVQTVSGEYILHVSGVYAGASVRLYVGLVGEAVGDFMLVDTFSVETKLKLTYVGDLRFQLLGSTGSTSITVRLQEIV